MLGHMDFRRFGDTELMVSTVGLGTGGASRLGLAYGNSEDQAIALVHRARELGVNYFDTAENYANEAVLGRALVGHRDEVVLSSKTGPVHPNGSLVTAEELTAALELSLRKLQTDHLDVYHLHRVSNRSLDHALEVLVPVLEGLRDAGKIRYLALSESSGGDVDHTMLQRALLDPRWNVAMVSFNLFNQSARARVLPLAIANGVGIEIMASARSQFSQPELLREEIDRLIAAGELAEGIINREDPLDFLRGDDREVTLTEASYRFAAHEPGVHVVLIGTGNVDHLEENISALNRGPLPSEISERLIDLFGHLRAEVHVPGRELGPV